MPGAVLTTGQSRWALHILICLLSAGAIAESAQSSRGASMFVSGDHGDIRGPDVVMGSVGLGGCVILRLARLLLPKPWRIYLDRLEFSFISVLWIFWTSTTMAFTAYITQTSVCVTEVEAIFLPTCPVLTLDLTVLYLLSISTLALLLVILSTALSPSYYSSLSTSLDPATKNPDPEGRDMFVMWDLALASPPPSPRLGPSGSILAAEPGVRNYGTSLPATPMKPAQDAVPANPYAPDETAPIIRKRDKFAEGRVWSYGILLVCSLGVLGSTIGVMFLGDPAKSCICVIIVACISATFAITFLVSHRKQRNRKLDSDDTSFWVRHDRALEFSFAGTLFLLWPLAAIIYTLYPATSYRPCSQPATESHPFSPEDLPGLSVCALSSTIISLAWLSACVMLVRVMGLIFPMPEMGSTPTLPLPHRGAVASSGEERVGLLGARPPPTPPAPAPRPQVKWGRLVAGEAFELGGDDDDDDN